MSEQSQILLETGTNEVEIMEFFLGTQRFGLNVAKLKTVVLFDPALVTPLPDCPPSLLGVYRFRDRTIPLIDLAQNMARPRLPDNPRPIVLVTEFNQMLSCFLVDGVHRIRRLFWKDIQPLPHFLSQYSARVIGSVQIDGAEVLLIDLEHIISELFPDAALDTHAIATETVQRKERDQFHIVLAEDSTVIRTLMVRTLTSAGYTHVTHFVNGFEAYEAIKKWVDESRAAQEPINKYLDLIISDIEMPEMDGLTLCKKVKKEMGLTSIPVFMFSSLINEQMTLKCQEVGADDWLTKPQIATLVNMIDKRLIPEPA